MESNGGFGRFACDGHGFEFALTLSGFAQAAKALKGESRYSLVDLSVTVADRERVPSLNDVRVLSDALGVFQGTATLTVAYAHPTRSLSVVQLEALTIMTSALASVCRQCTVTMSGAFHSEDLPSGIAPPPLLVAGKLEALAINAPREALTLLLDALIQTPSILRHLDVRTVASPYGEKSDVRLPPGLTNLYHLTITSDITTSVTATLTMPPTQLKLLRLPASRRHYNTPPAIVHARAQGPDTTIVGSGFHMAEAGSGLRVSVIKCTGRDSVTPEQAWRTRLLDTRSTEATDIHCDAVVVLEAHRKSAPLVIGAPSLLVVRREYNDPTAIPAVLQAAWSRHPEALAVQAAPPTSEWAAAPTTVFRDDRRLTSVEGMTDLVVALSIASGDNGAAALAEIEETRPKFFAKAFLPSLVAMANAAAGNVLTMTEAGLA